MKPTTIGLDVAKHVFQLHGIAGGGQVILRRQLRRSELLAFFKALPTCVVGVEACASAHYWAREISALSRDQRLLIRVEDAGSLATTPARPAQSLDSPCLPVPCNEPIQCRPAQREFPSDLLNHADPEALRVAVQQVADRGLSAADFVPTRRTLNFLGHRGKPTSLQRSVAYFSYQRQTGKRVRISNGSFAI